MLKTSRTCLPESSACMALEDAVSISHDADHFAGDFERAFAAYQAQRVLRATRVQLQSRAIDVSWSSTGFCGIPSRAPLQQSLF